MKNGHLVVLIIYSETEIIKQCFDSIYKEGFDYFIVENYSENSPKISEFFMENKEKYKNIVGYIQFEKNISATALDCFLKEYDSTIKQYKYLTVSDGDFYMYDFVDAMREAVLGFQDPRCLVSSIHLYLKNNYSNTGQNRIVGIGPYVEDQKRRSGIPHGHDRGITSNCFLTFQTDRSDFLKNIHYIDTFIFNEVKNMGGVWLKSAKNQAYHLTWDLYVDGNPYFEWKKQVIKNIWDKKEEVGYTKYI